MNKHFRLARTFGFLVACYLTLPLHAHLMVEQHGSLNIQPNGIFAVLSVPVSAFAFSDENADGLMSLTELEAHKHSIISLVNSNALMSVNGEKLSMRGVLITADHSHSGPNQPAENIIVMGRYAIDDVNGLEHFYFDLFGTGKAQTMTITTKRFDTTEKTKTQLTPKQNRIVFNQLIAGQSV